MRAALALLAVITGLAGTAHADLRFAIRNDTFTGIDPPFDDLGFTNDLELAFWRPYRGWRIGGRWMDRLVTEAYREGAINDRRQDLVELVATAERTWATASEAGDAAITVGARAGTTTTGNWGGRWYQNAFHTLCHCGTLLSEGLADRYTEGRRYGALIGARVEGAAGQTVHDSDAERPRHGGQVYAALDGQHTAGTGVRWIEGAAGVRGMVRIGCTQLGAHGELALALYDVQTRTLAIPGGYGEGWQRGWRVGVHVAHGRVRVDYEYRANEGGSGEPIGMIAVTIAQAGTTF